MAKQRFTPKQVADTLNETRGMVFLAAKKLGCSDDTIYNYAKRYKVVGDALRQQRGQFVDMAELKLWNAVNEGEAWAVQFALRTLGKGRGYVERQEVTGSDGGPVQVRHQVDLTELTDDELAFLESIAIRAVRPSGDSSGAGAA